jgi:hypothetical protein
LGTCSLPGGWSFLAAAPAYSAFAGVLSGFLFLGVITLMTERSRFEGSGDSSSSQGTVYDSRSGSRDRALMLFLPALLSLLISSFLFGEVSGDQVCARGYTEGILAASLLAMRAIGVFGGIGWMVDVYATSNRDLRLTANVFIYLLLYSYRLLG